MPSHWENKPENPSNLRLYMPGEGWRAFSDKLKEDEPRAVEQEGSRALIESAFLNALNASNLLVLTGAGTSFAATNAAGQAQAPGMTDLWSAVKTAATDKVFDAVCEQFSDAKIENNIEKLLSLCKIFLELHENAHENNEAVKQIKQFVADAEKTILQKMDFVSTDTKVGSHALVVRKIGRRGVRKSRTKIFTTNYDLCFEEAARRQRFTVIDGFSHSLDQFYDRTHFDFDLVRRETGQDAPNYIANVFHLYKLHGSVDWRRFGSEIMRSRSDDGLPVLIYPRSSKYQEAFEPPYLDMLGAFQAALREPDTALIVSGFGFNDDHISRPVLAALEANMSLRLIVCDPIFIGSKDELDKGDHAIGATALPNKFLARFQKLVDAGDPRIHLINGRFADMALTLPDLVGETDRERHASRVRALRDGAEGKPK